MDDDDKKPEDAPPKPARDAAQDAGAKLRVVSEEDLRQILAAHKTWVETDGEKGKRANFFRANLQGADLCRANLQRANFIQANLRGANLVSAELRGADLSFADLRGADLRYAKLQGAFFRSTTFERLIATTGGESTRDLEAADLTFADFRDANLSDAKLSNVTGLLAHNLAGADLSNAKLPKDIAAFIALARAEKISRNCRAIFVGILTGCVYSLLTVATTTDARLLTNSASSPLPIIGTEVPIAHFYIAAPLILLFAYFYFQLYLQRLWTGLADLPAISPDGRPLDKRLYPWLISGFVRAHFKHLKDERTFLQHMENWAIVVLAWWIVPLTVMLFWGRYLPRHEWFGTGLHIVLLTISIAGAILLNRHAGATLRRDVTAFRWRRPWSDRRIYQAAVALGLGAVFAIVSLGAIEGEVRRSEEDGSIFVLPDVATWAPYAFDRMGYRTYANLREADVSTKPATWTGLAERPAGGLDNNLMEKARAELAQVKGAPLRSADLRYANADGAFLARASLQEANLQGADLLSASLVLADLFGANLQGAFLGLANLQEANLNSANLQGADLHGAELQGAKLFRSNLQGADLARAKGVTQEQLDEACGDDLTTLPDYLADYQMKVCPEPEQPPSN